MEGYCKEANRQLVKKSVYWEIENNPMKRVTTRIEERFWYRRKRLLKKIDGILGEIR